MNNVIIETIVAIVANLAITIFGVFGAWLVLQIGKNQKLANISSAIDELTLATEITVLDLQQTLVDEIKEKSADGKLTKDEITALGDLLLEETLDKISASCIDVLKAAEIDVNALIKGAGEAIIAEMKKDE